MSSSGHPLSAFLLRRSLRQAFEIAAFCDTLGTPERAAIMILAGLRPGMPIGWHAAFLESHPANIWFHSRKLQARKLVRLESCGKNTRVFLSDPKHIHLATMFAEIYRGTGFDAEGSE